MLGCGLIHDFCTHDTKRGEDVRARIGVLSQVPVAVGQKFIGAKPYARPDAVTGRFLWQISGGQ